MGLFQHVPVDPKPSLAAASSYPLLGMSGVCLDVLNRREKQAA